jgi:hypothetical protein
MKIEKQDNELVIRLPLYQRQNNCYMEEEDLAMTDNLIGVIAGEEYTISQLNDLSYKGTQQEGMPIVYFTTEEELREACKIAGIEIWEHPICAYCGKAIRGVFTYGEKGNMCYDCELSDNYKVK